MEPRIVVHPQLGPGTLLKTYMSGHEWEVLFESGKRFRLPAREFEVASIEANKPRLTSPIPRQIVLETDQFRARQTLETLRFGIVPMQDVETLTIGLEAETISLNRGVERSQERGGDVIAVIGDYGYGKSHFIELAARRALRENFLVMSTSLDLVEVPPSKPLEIYRNLAASTRYPDHNQHGLRPLLQQAREHFGVVSELSRLTPLGTACPLVSALSALATSTDQTAYEDIVRWISGQIKPTTAMRTYLKKPPTLYAIGEVARLYTYLLTGLSVLAKQLGYSGVAVLIDESELYSMIKNRTMKDRADSFFKALIYAALGPGRIDANTIPQHRLANYPVVFAENPNLFFLFALTESDNRLPVDDWLAPSQILRLDDRFIEKDIRKFMRTLGDYHTLAYSYTLNGNTQAELAESAAAMLSTMLNQHRINLRELIRNAVTLYDLMFLYEDYSSHQLLQELADGLGL